MSTELATIDGMSYEEIARLTGVDTGNGSGNRLPILKVNREFVVDIEEVEYDVTPGVFKVVHEGKLVLSSKAGVKFRPHMQAFQYVRFDPEFVTGKVYKGKPVKGAYVNKTVIRKSFQEEFNDEFGGMKCGKVKKEQYDGLTLAQKKAHDQTKCYRYIYGYVSFDGKTPQGDEVQIRELPVMLKLNGSNFMPFDEEYVKPLSKAKKNLFQYDLDLSTERKKNNETTYYIVHFKYNPTSTLPTVPAVVELLKAFQETINAENEQVMEKHRKALQGDVMNDEAEEVVGLIDNDDPTAPWGD